MIADDFLNNILSGMIYSLALEMGDGI